MRKTRKESMNFRREGVASRYAVQRVCSATADADAGAEGGVAGWAAEAAGAGLDLDAGVVEAVEVCFGVLGPAIMFVSPLNWRDVQCNMGGSLLIVGSSRRVQFVSIPGLPRVPLRTALRGPLFTRLGRRVFPFPSLTTAVNFSSLRHHHAPCRTQPRNSRLHKNNKRGTTGRAFSAQR